MFHKKNDSLMETDIVDNDIPLLVSKSAMKKAEMKLDVVNDEAEIFGKEVKLENTSSGHYSIPLNEVTVSLENCLFADRKMLDDKKKKIVKLHKQSAHPSAHKLKTLLKDAELYDTEIGHFLDELSNTCDVCLRTKKTQHVQLCLYLLLQNLIK